MPMKLDFKAIAESVDVEAVASQLRIPLRRAGHDLRAACPACRGDERSLAVYPETNSFRCYAASLSGDCISLWAHINGYTGMYRAAKELAELFRIADASGTVRTDPDRDTAPATAPQKPEPRSQPGSTPASGQSTHGQVETSPVQNRPKVDRSFDPDAYLAKLQYTPEVAELGISQEDAEGLGIGFSPAGMHKGIAFALRWPSGEIAGFCSVISGEVKLPKRLIPPRVIQLRRA